MMKNSGSKKAEVWNLSKKAYVGVAHKKGVSRTKAWLLFS